MKDVLIICIGNICRSPMAEGLLKAKAHQHHLSLSVQSAGLHALVNQPAAPETCTIMRREGMDVELHRARQLTQPIVFSADLVLTMTLDQQQCVESLYPATRGRVHRLGKWDDYDIPDPYQHPSAAFEHAYCLIKHSIDAWYNKLWA
jgi:protein-tyrosine phosphatase